MTDLNPRKNLEEDICIQIFKMSAMMVGVCLIVIGLLRIVITIEKANTLADDLLSVDAILFFISCVSSCWAFLMRSNQKLQRLEYFAEYVFIAAMLFMVVICIFITYAFTISLPT